MVRNLRAYILHALSERDLTSQDVMVERDVERSNVNRILRSLRRAGQAHIKAWRQVRGVGTPPYAVWTHGPGQDAERPITIPANVKCKAWRERLIERYGHSIAQKMLRSRNNGGAERVVINGKTVYERGVACK